MRPLILRDIADDVEMHESTISRVVTNKYMHTPRGLFEIKYFFGSSIHKAGGDDVASKSVQDDIRKIISEEDHRKPFSDQEIVKRLWNFRNNHCKTDCCEIQGNDGGMPSSRRKKYF